MPFTLAHPAAILPLRGTRFLRTAPLLIGAMAPDLPYFLPASLKRLMPETHDLAASVTTDLALGYLALFLVVVLRRPLTALLAPRARWLWLSALVPFRREWTAWVYAAPAIVIGVWSHLLWDSFTHTDGWMVHRVAALSAPVTVWSYTGPMCHVLQYVSSVVGLAIMSLWYLRLPAPPRASLGQGAPRSAATPILVLAGVAALLIGGVQATVYYRRTQFVYGSLDLLLTHSLACFALFYLMAGLLRMQQHRHGE